VALVAVMLLLFDIVGCLSKVELMSQSKLGKTTVQVNQTMNNPALNKTTIPITSATTPVSNAIV
jgi:hypothetical protein